MLSWHQSSIRTRIILTSILPVVYLFCSLLGFSYHARWQEADEELAERAAIVGTALAQSVEYNVTTRNLRALQQSINALVQSDQNIFRIDILDVNRREIAHATSYHAIQAEIRYFEAPIHRQLIWVNLVAPAVVASAEMPSVNAGAKAKELLGVVRVTMSATRMQAKQIQRFYFELAMACLALAVSTALAWHLAKSLVKPLKNAVSALGQIRAGDYATQVEISTGGEMGDLQTSINAMATSLQQATTELENKVALRTRELQASTQQALQADAEKRKLIQKVHTILEEERQSIAIEIHDELNASLIAARLDAQRILQILKKQQEQSGTSEATASMAEIAQKTEAILKITRDLYASGRNLVRRLRPEVLDMLGLNGAIDEMLRHYNASPGACQFEFIAEGDFSVLESALAISAYRIVQEALSNILKHAQASHAKVVLQIRPAEGDLQIRITDDGIGMQASQQAKLGDSSEKSLSGIGLTGMRERVAAFHGEIVFAAGVNGGTSIAICLPLRLPA